MVFNVLSLFDGISVAKVALDRLHLDCTYYASEIDKYALRISAKNHPAIIQLGDVRTVASLPPIDLLIGGSPCQDISSAGLGAGLAGDRSGLFYEYLRILKAVQPKYFVLENIAVVKKEWRDTITAAIGVEPIKINSALVSAQSRRRLYWTNIQGVTQPEDKHILLKDILEGDSVDRDKSLCIDAQYYRGTNEKQYLDRSHRQIVYGNTVGARTLVSDRGNVIRMLTPVECERLQTLPDGYTEFGANGKRTSDTQRYRCLGNAFTADVIVHILSFADFN
jgi:DNA (cytosine-5)-methyltransferase 3A